jgi:two-component system sensor histidine kinase UhpB
MTPARVEVLDVAERRLVRLGFDIHDGPVQDVAALLADLRLVKGRLADNAPATAALGDLESRLGVLHQELRDLAQSLESRALVDRDLREVLESDAAAFRRRCDTELDLQITGDLDELTASQRTATARIAQEALSNIREHSRATCARLHVHADDHEISISVWDDGVGFGVRRSRAPRQDRLGLVGMRERARLLHGSLLVDSRPGGPTAIEARLPRWRPAEASATG